MGKLIYTAITSLDGYIEDADGDIQWGQPGDEVFAYINDLQRPVDTYLYGRRLYETMVYWETVELSDQAPLEREFAALWKSTDKVVYSKSLEKVSSAKTRIERSFDPKEIEDLKTHHDSDINIGGAALAAEAFQMGLIDECQLFLTPVALGGGKAALPANLRLHLLDERRFSSGVVYLRYGVTK